MPVECSVGGSKSKNLICCSGSDALKVKFDLIVCNLPYLATDEILDMINTRTMKGLEADWAAREWRNVQY